jgi:hypothetical protein
MLPQATTNDKIDAWKKLLHAAEECLGVHGKFNYLFFKSLTSLTSSY